MQTSGENKKNIRPFRIVLSLVALLVAYGIFQAAGGFSMEIFRKKELDTKTEAAYREQSMRLISSRKTSPPWDAV